MGLTTTLADADGMASICCRSRPGPCSASAGGSFTFAISPLDLFEIPSPVRAAVPWVALTPAREATSPADLVHVGVLGRVFVIRRAVILRPLMGRSVPHHVLRVGVLRVITKIGQRRIQPVSVEVTNLQPLRTRTEKRRRDKNMNWPRYVSAASREADHGVAVRVEGKPEHPAALLRPGSVKAAHPAQVRNLIYALVFEDWEPVFVHMEIIREILSRCHWWTGDPQIGPPHLAAACEAREAAKPRNEEANDR